MNSIQSCTVSSLITHMHTHIKTFKKCSAYADDILITARTKQTLINTFKKLKNISLQFGLIVNGNKTKCMKCTRKEIQLNKLIVDNKRIDQVRSFSYLGTIVNGCNSLEEEIRERIFKGNKAFYANKTLLKVIWCPGNPN